MIPRNARRTWPRFRRMVMLEPRKIIELAQGGVTADLLGCLVDRDFIALTSPTGRGLTRSAGSVPKMTSPLKTSRGNWSRHQMGRTSCPPCNTLLLMSRPLHLGLQHMSGRGLGDRQGRTSLHAAASYGDLSEVRRLLYGP